MNRHDAPRIHRERLFAMRRIRNSANFNTRNTRRRRIDGGRPHRGTEIGGMILDRSGSRLSSKSNANRAAPPRPRTRAPFTLRSLAIDTLVFEN